MKLLQFLTELQSRGGKVDEVQIYSHEWTRAWATGFFVAKISDDSVWASMKRADYRHSVRLGIDHSALQSEVVCVSLSYKSSHRRKLVIASDMSNYCVRLMLSAPPIAALPVSE